MESTIETILSSVYITRTMVTAKIYVAQIYKHPYVIDYYLIPSLSHLLLKKMYDINIVYWNRKRELFTKI